MANIQDIKSFKEEIHNQTEKVEIPRLSVDKALLVINSEIKNTQDAFLYFASLNLLNAYVKKHRKEISYGFKGKINPGIDSIINNEIEGVLFGYDEDEKCTLVNASGLQFTFHGMVLSDLQKKARNVDDTNHKYYTVEEWEGLRLQPLAEKVFEFAEQLEGLTIDIESLLDNENELE